MTSVRYSFIATLFFLTALTVLSPSCKSKKKNTFIKRAYHNLTARDNGYFNARQRIIAAEKQTEKSFVDSYDKLLPVFRFPDDKQAKSITPQMDEAIKKASLVIQRHEISKWIDDCYLLIGQAYFYKRDFFTANESFQYVAGKYKANEIANDAYVYLINSYVQLGQLPKAESVINVALASDNFPDRLRSDLYASIANFHIAQKNYSKAADFLKKAIEERNTKAERIRYTYIVAQLSQMTGEESQAIVYYQRVLKMNPPYEMAFNAKLNSARLAPATFLASSKKDLEKQLQKMLRDDKNRDFKDQIYYVLGNVYMRKDMEDKALSSYILSAQSSTKNTNQKGLSYLKVATIYFDGLDYENAQHYYDSASSFLSKENPDYNEVVKRKNSLAILVRNLQVIRREDSLQTLSKLSEKDRLAAVDKVIKKEDEEKRRQEEEEQRIKDNLALNPLIGNNPTNVPGATPASGSTWYFYNMSAVSTGYTDFLKRFGRRPLEDNWRRSSKETIVSLNQKTEEEEEEEQIDTTGMGAAKTEAQKKRLKYLKNIPVSEKQIAASNDRIAEAYYNIGVFYRDEMVNFKESIKYFEKLLKLYPDNKFKLETYYNLYRIYSNMNDIPKADYYKNILLKEYPNSSYAKVILDPDFVSEAHELNKQAQAFYDATYNQYLAGNYNAVFANKKESDRLYASTSMASRFAYLNAVAIAKTKGVDSFEVALYDIINKYPPDAITDLARETLKKITEQKNAPKTVQATNPAVKPGEKGVNVSNGQTLTGVKAPNTDSLKLKAGATTTTVSEEDQFKVDKGPMYLVIAVKIANNVNDTKNELNKFNQLYFGLERLIISSQLLDEDQNMLIVKEFKNLDGAKKYQNVLNAKATEVIKIPKTEYTVFLISDQNFAKLLKRRNINQYLEFYQKNY